MAENMAQKLKKGFRKIGQINGKISVAATLATDIESITKELNSFSAINEEDVTKEVEKIKKLTEFIKISNATKIFQSLSQQIEIL